MVELIKSYLYSFLTEVSKAIQNFGDFHKKIKKYQKKSDHQLFDYAAQHINL